jgi:hypothetical protein
MTSRAFWRIKNMLPLGTISFFRRTRNLMMSDPYARWVNSWTGAVWKKLTQHLLCMQNLCYGTRGVLWVASLLDSFRQIVVYHYITFHRRSIINKDHSHDCDILFPDHFGSLASCDHNSDRYGATVTILKLLQYFIWSLPSVCIFSSVSFSLL